MEHSTDANMAAHASDSSTMAGASAATGASGSIKDKMHFKKSMIVEYEKIESSSSSQHHHLPHNDDSQSSSSCASFRSATPVTPGPPTGKLSLSSRLDEIRPSSLLLHEPALPPPPPLPPLPPPPPPLPSLSSLISFNEQLNRLKSIGVDDGSSKLEQSSIDTHSIKQSTSIRDVLDTDGTESNPADQVSNQKKRKKQQSESSKSSKVQQQQHKKAKSESSSGKKEKSKSGTGGSKKKLDKSESKKTPTKKKRKDEEKVLYCICREEANKRFMIACDNCDEWYHGACVGVSESLSNKIKSFFCHLCRSKKPSLSIKYKSRFREIGKIVEKNGKFDEASADSSLAKFYRESKARIKKETELLKAAGIVPTEGKQVKKEAKKAASGSKEEASGESGQQEAAGTKYYGKTNISSEDFDNFFSAITMINQNLPPSNGAGTNVSQMDHDYLGGASSSHSRPLQTSHGEANAPARQRTRSSGDDQEDSSLDSFSSTSSMGTSSSKGSSTSNTGSSRSSSGKSTGTTASGSEHDSSSESGMSTEGSDVENEDDSGQESSSSEEEGASSEESKTGGRKTIKKPGNRKAAGKNRLSSSNKKQKTTIKTGLKSKKPVKRLVTGNKQLKNTKMRKTLSSGGPKDSASAASVNSNSNQMEETPREPSHCLGPECVNESRGNSKYCSVECGMKLAKSRLMHFMRDRFDENMLETGDVDQLNYRALETINAEMDALRVRLVELEAKHAELDKVIERAKFASINPNIEKDRAKSLDSNETEIFCATCGLLISEKHALKHMEKCYNKVESQAFFGSYHKANIEGGQPLFCDYFNPQTKMYCKRLKTMCPEHEKEKKISETEVCGCPLPSTSNLLQDSENELCLAPKRTCSVHFKWEKLRRAQIDLEKLRTWLKLEELMEQKRLNEAVLNQRRGLLSLMLFNTNYSTASTARSTNVDLNVNQSTTTNS